MSSNFKILITDTLAKEALDLFLTRSNFDVQYFPGISEQNLFEKVKDTSGLIIRTATQVSKDLLDHAPKLELVCRAGIGLDNIDIEECQLRNITVLNTPRGNRVSTAEHAMGLIFSLARQIPQADFALKNGRWEREKYTGIEIESKKLGIIGLGNIGSLVAKKALGLGMKVTAHDPFISPNVAKELNITLVNLQDILKESDFITLHVPLTSLTADIVNLEFLSKMKKTSYLINTSRGKVVNERDLLKTLELGLLAGAALDVFAEEPLSKNNPLCKSNKIILTPHTAGQTKESLVKISQECANQVIIFFTSKA